MSPRSSKLPVVADFMQTLNEMYYLNTVIFVSALILILCVAFKPVINDATQPANKFGDDMYNYFVKLANQIVTFTPYLIVFTRRTIPTYYYLLYSIVLWGIYKLLTLNLPTTWNTFVNDNRLGGAFLVDDSAVGRLTKTREILSNMFSIASQSTFGAAIIQFIYEYIVA